MVLYVFLFRRRIGVLIAERAIVERSCRRNLHQRYILSPKRLSLKPRRRSRIAERSCHQIAHRRNCIAETASPNPRRRIRVAETSHSGMYMQNVSVTQESDVKGNCTQRNRYYIANIRCVILRFFHLGGDIYKSASLSTCEWSGTESHLKYSIVVVGQIGSRRLLWRRRDNSTYFVCWPTWYKSYLDLLAGKQNMFREQQKTKPCATPLPYVLLLSNGEPFQRFRKYVSGMVVATSPKVFTVSEWRPCPSRWWGNNF